MSNWEKIGNNDLRLDATPAGGFRHVVLYDADDHDTLIINEDDLVALRDRLTEIINEEQAHASDHKATQSTSPTSPTVFDDPYQDLW